MNAPEAIARKPKTNARVAEFLAVVNDKATEQTIRTFVMDHVITNALVEPGSIDDAIARLAGMDRSPAQLIVDLSNSAMPLSDLERLAKVCEPSVSVIALGDRNDVGLFRNLLKLGIQDYLVKPITHDLLQRTLDMPVNGATALPQTRTGKVISFLGTRGGVGVTSIAANLARHLADGTHRRVAYVDLNLHGGSVNTLLGLTSNNGLSDALLNVHRLDPQFIERAMVAKGNRLHVLSTELGYDAEFALRMGAVSDLLTELKRYFHYVLLDLPGRSGPIVEEALDGSQVVYIVADRSVQSAKETLRLLRHAEGRRGEPATSVILNHPAAPAANGGHVEGPHFASAIGRSVLHELPFDGKAVVTAENMGTPIDHRSRFAEAIVRLADSLTGQQTRGGAAPWYARLVPRRSA